MVVDEVDEIPEDQQCIGTGTGPGQCLYVSMYI